MFGLMPNCRLDLKKPYYCMADYQGAEARWCPGCGDHAVLATVQRLCRDKQLPPEKTVFVSGIGCSSRFPHYMRTYGFHGLHGRALPVAAGIRMRRPDLHVFVVMGDGDCCSIGTAHWVHTIRYNMKMVVMLFDNEIYGLTKGQTSPTSRAGTRSSTHPSGSVLPGLNPLPITLGVTNVSFVAQTVDWNPAHMMATLDAAYEHPGFAFIRIIQRCPHFAKGLHEELLANPDRTLYLDHKQGITLPDEVARMYKNRARHDPSDLIAALTHAMRTDVIPIGLFFQDRSRTRYDVYGAANINTPPERKEAMLNRELDRFAV
ncbi:MAG: 2-oxoglutarate oxidoreductase [Planctomycetes bacterium]|nr:2-oxoglutarate oxidoreductase [Planctomycetota bacterium]